MAPSLSPFRSAERLRNSAGRQDAASLAAEIPPDFELYARSAELTEQTLAEAMSTLRLVGTGVWNLIQVLEGSLLVRVEAATGGVVLVPPGGAAAIPPGTRYDLRFIGVGRCFVEFHVRKDTRADRFPAGHC